MKKLCAYIIDIVLMIIFVLLLTMLITAILYLFLGDTVFKLERPIEIILLIVYFFGIPKLIGGTFGYKIMRIKVPYSYLSYISPFSGWSQKQKYKFPKQDLKKDEIIKIVVEDGRWICPSCNEPSNEVYDVCSNCGQEIEKE